MDEDLKLESLISNKALNDIVSLLLDVHDQNERSSTTRYDDNYTYFSCLYRKTLNALVEYAKQSKLIEDLSCNNKAILQPIDSSLKLRFLNCTPFEHRRKKPSNDIYDLFSILEKPSFSYSLFDDRESNVIQSFGFFFIENDSNNSPYVRLQIFDAAWNLQLEWSSDNVQDITFTPSTFNEISKELPKAKLLESGSDTLKPVASVDSSTDSAANE